MPEITYPSDKPLSCSQCDHKSTQSSDLKRHERTHTGEKPFSCNNCNKKFSQFEKMKIHERIHSGTKPFSCFQCDYQCAQLGNLKRHERIHTGMNPEAAYNMASHIHLHKFWENIPRRIPFRGAPHRLHFFQEIKTESNFQPNTPCP